MKNQIVQPRTEVLLEDTGTLLLKKHGKWGSAEYHKGDIGNFTADEKGNGTITLTTDQWSIGGDDETKNILGKGLIVHQGSDDFTTQPTGNAGGRVACAGIIK
jgi:Cu-Zn family superoxide dismutase